MIDLSHLGLTPQVLGEVDQLKPTVKGGLLLLDGDGFCYTAAANAAKEMTAFNRLKEAIYTQMFLTGCDKAYVHLTPKGCAKNNRDLLNTVKPYQMNRVGIKGKPKHLDFLRSEWAAEEINNTCPEITMFLNWDIEADDALMIDHYRNENAILVSPDKDLLISPFAQYIESDGKVITLPEGDRFGWIDRKHWVTEGGKKSSKMIGKGTLFFLAQMLMGDSADNVQGIIKLNGKLCGEAGAYEALHHFKDENEAVNFVLDSYRVIKQNPIPEAYALWLLRSRDDTAYKYFNEHDLTAINKDYLDTCYYDREWRKEIEGG